MTKRIFALLLALVLVVGLLPAGAMAAEGTPTATGTLTGALKWSYYGDTNELVISGSGDITDTSAVAGYKTTATKLTVEEGVTAIGEKAFSSWKKLTSVELAGSVKSIGYRAFYSCSALTTVNLKEGLELIGDSAFRMAKKIETVTIPGTVTVIEQYAFYNMTADQTINFADDWDTVSSRVTFGKSWWGKAKVYCNGVLRETPMPTSGKAGENVTWSFDTATGVLSFAGTGPMADYDDSSPLWLTTYLASITSVVVGEGVTSVGNGALDSCSNVTSVTLPSTLERIGNSAFEWCKALTEITLPASLKEIGIKAFRGCAALTRIVIPDAVTKIGDNAFDSWTADQTIAFTRTKADVEANVTLGVQWRNKAKVEYSDVTETAPKSGTYGENIRWELNDEGLLTFTGTGAMAEPDESVNFPDKNTYPWLLWEGDIKAIHIEKGITSIPRRFARGMTVTELTLPDGLTNISKEAFYNFSLTDEDAKIYLPLSVEHLGPDAFFNVYYVYLDCTPGYYYNNILNRDWNFDRNLHLMCDPTADKSWFEGAAVTLQVGDQTLEGKVDLTNGYLSGNSVTFDYGMLDIKDFTLENTTVTVKKDGTNFTYSMPSTINAWAYDSNNKSLYLSRDPLSIVPGEGVTGDAFQLDVIFNVKQLDYTFTGSGTEEDPYLVRNVMELRMLAQTVARGKDQTGVYYKQTTDLDMAEETAWAGIGTDRNHKFNGIYDGGNHRIRNLVLEDQTVEYVGLFHWNDDAAIVRNLIIDESCSFKAWRSVASVVVTGGTVENCVNYANVYAHGKGTDGAQLMAGGIAGYVSKVINCTNYGTVTGNPDAMGWSAPGGNTVGGVAAEAKIAYNCMNYGEVTGGAYVGGVVGASASGQIVACGNRAKVTGRTEVGGIVGQLNQGVVENCYNTGDVTATQDKVGGLVGTVSLLYSSMMNRKGVFNSYSTGNVSYPKESENPVAGKLIGSYKGDIIDGDEQERIGVADLYCRNVGQLPPIGTYDAGDKARTRTTAALKSDGFVDELNAHTNVALYAVTWSKDGDPQTNGGYPTFSNFHSIPNYACYLLSVKVGGVNLYTDADGNFKYTMPNGTDMTALEVETTVSDRATVSPANGEKVDFSKGPVTFTVTAEDGVHTRSYIVNVKEAGPNGVTSLRFTTGGMAYNLSFLKKDGYGSEEGIILEPGEFDQDTLTYTKTRYDNNILYVGLNSFYAQAYVWAVPAETGAKMTLSLGDLSGEVKPTTDMTANHAFSSDLSYGKAAHYGVNSFKLTVTPPEGGKGKETVYTFNLELLPTVKSLKLSGAPDMSLNTDFSSRTFDYTLTLPETAPVITPTAVATDSKLATVSFVPAPKDDGTLDLTGLDEFKMIVTGGEGDNQRTTTYTFKLHWTGTYDVTTESNVPGTQFHIYDEKMTEVIRKDNGAYELNREKAYTYAAVAQGYITATGTIENSESLPDGKLSVTLQPVPASSIKKLDAFWPSFRGNDNNMAVTDVKLPTSMDDAELLWTSKAGIGMDSGAVGSPIIVDGYIYTNSGTRLLKIDKTTGTVVASGNMVGASNFAIVPPTYGDGMIFVPLSDGRVQAFNAETLESLWVFQDQLKGQSDSSIAYSDGCVYVGFWNGEDLNANFVCLAVDDEDPTSTTETKYPLWTYTRKGGFYWAGACVQGDYVVVGTEDGDNDHVKQSASLLVFNKKTGELVDSRDNYAGDIRSNVAYDAATDRVYFTTKGGYFYSERIDWTTGKLDRSQSKEVFLNGMSTSTPVVYNGRAYVGVCATITTNKQFAPYAGHNITIIDLSSWTVAYTVETKGYPQTSGLVSTGSDGSVYVYFTENYTPGKLRYIKDQAGATAPLESVIEEGKYCAPVLFEPEGELAQYCISSPVIDETGTIFFKNDTGYMMAVSAKATGLTVEAHEPAVDGKYDETKVEAYVEMASTGLRRKVAVTLAQNEEGEWIASYTYGTELEGYTQTTLTAPLHTYNGWEIEAEATCESAGLLTKACVYCGEKLTHELPALGHDWDEGTVTKTATCSEEGEMTFTCKRCSATKTEPIAKLAHDYQAVVTAPTCEGVGYTTYTCSACGDSYVSDIVEALGHEYEETVTAPTCDKMGYTTHTCTRCGMSYVDSFTAALEHDFRQTVTKEATCTEEGELTFTCTHEGCGVTYTQPIPKADHELEETKVEATCTEYGYTTYSCKNCDHSYIADIVEPAGHSWNEGTLTKQPTAFEEGEIVFTCSACGETRTETVAKLAVCDGGKNCPSAKFSDVDPAKWYHEAVDFAVVNGLFAGTSATTFSPDDSMTRAMLVTVLWRLAGQPEAKTAASFRDVDAGQYYAKAVAWAAENGIVTGTGADTFEPDAEVTREQMAAILYRYAKLNGVDVSKTADLKDFPDADKTSAYAKEALAWAVGSGLINGTLENGATLLDPTGSAARAQVAAILMRYARVLG